jgi:hypothetical protein
MRPQHRLIDSDFKKKEEIKAAGITNIHPFRNITQQLRKNFLLFGKK